MATATANVMRAHSHRLLLLVGLLVLLGLGPARISGQDAPAFGAHLLLVADAPQPMQPGVVLHARFATAAGEQFIASAAAESMAALSAAGIPVQILDQDTRGKVYYFVDSRVLPTQNPPLRERVAARGAILLEGSNQLLIAVAQEEEGMFVESLPAQGIPISLLSPDPLVLEDDVSVRALAAPDSPAAPDPTIRGLLDRFTTAELTPLISQLSGEEAVSLGGATVTLANRYTLSTAIRNAERYLYQQYEEMGLPAAYVDWTYGHFNGRTVVAELTGREHPERVWLVGGHFDAMSEVPDRTTPGADDNATGTAATLLLARLLKAYSFADTIRFVHFSGEEQGQWGSKEYARSLRLAGETIEGYINLDMIGWDGNDDKVVELHTGAGNRSNAIATAFMAASERYEQELRFERKTNTASRFSDHSPFWDQGYPAFLVIENFFVDQIQADRNPWYHSTGDRLDRVNVDYAARIGRVALATVAELAGLLPAGPRPTAIAPTATPAPTPTTAPPLPETCQDLLVDGGFEAQTGWQFGSTPYRAAYVAAPVHEGASALRLGIPDADANRLAHSSAFQWVTLPAAAEIRLDYAQFPGGSGNGYREALLLASGGGILAVLDRNRAVGSGAWETRTVDLTRYGGQRVGLYFNVYNNGQGDPVWTYLDTVRLTACKTPLDQKGRMSE